MKPLCKIRGFVSCRTVKVMSVIYVLAAVGCVGTAHAATCAKGYWLDDTGSCTECSDKYYCPGDDIRHPCPTTDTDYEPILREYYNVYRCGGRGEAAWTSITNSSPYGCVYNIRACDDVGNRYYLTFRYDTTLGYYFTPPESVGNGFFCESVAPGYFMSDEFYANNVKYYHYCNPCTNAPANAHYTGAGTPDVGNCPWECDAGYGHTSDDRCLPLCRIGDTAMNGINIYAEKHTKYAMGVPRNGATCWISPKRADGGNLFPVF